MIKKRFAPLFAATRCKCTRERREDMLIGNVRIVTSKMSCAQVGERESCVVALSETNTKEDSEKLLNLWTSEIESFDKIMYFYWLR